MGILDHPFADVDARHRPLGIGMGHFMHPSSRPAANIQHIVNIGKISAFREDPAYHLHCQLILVEQARHLCRVLGIDHVSALILILG